LKVVVVDLLDGLDQKAARAACRTHVFAVDHPNVRIGSVRGRHGP